MSTIDIRNPQDPVTTIRIAERNEHTYVADIIEKSTNIGSAVVRDSSSGRGLRVNNRAHAEHLVKGLQKAIELGWLK